MSEFKELNAFFESKGFSKTIAEIPKGRPTNRLVAKEALKLGACIKVNDKGKIACILNKRWFTFNNGLLFTEEYHASKSLMQFMNNKMAMKNILSAANLPVPRGFSVNVHDGPLIKSIIESLGYPVCLKPLSGSKGKNVFPSLGNHKEFLNALDILKETDDEVLIEENISGFDARITTLFGRFYLASLRVRPFVTGDGESTINQLVTLEREYRIKRQLARASALKVDSILVACIEGQGLTLESVPEEGAIVRLRDNANLSTGAEAHDVTSFLNKNDKKLFSRIASKFSDIAILGIDVMFLSDPRVSASSEFKIIEINTAPGISGHYKPYSGRSRNVAGTLVKKVLL